MLGGVIGFCLLFRSIFFCFLDLDERVFFRSESDVRKSTRNRMILRCMSIVFIATVFVLNMVNLFQFFETGYLGSLSVFVFVLLVSLFYGVIDVLMMMMSVDLYNENRKIIVK